MHNRFSSYQKRVKSYIDRKVYKDEDDLEFLKNAEKYYAGYLSYSGRLSTIISGFKMRRYLYPEDIFLICIAKLIAKLI